MRAGFGAAADRRAGATAIAAVRPLVTSLGILLSVLLSACGGVVPQDYAAEQPILDLRSFLDGELTGWGIYRGRDGKVTKRFRIDMQAQWQGDRGEFIERFSFADGTEQRREWLLQRLDDHRYTAQANDSVGPGRGEAWGNTMHWQYTIRTETDSGTWDLDYDYWMYMIDAHTLINRATVSKFGIAVGDIAVTFRKGKLPHAR